MDTHTHRTGSYSRREFGKLALAGLPASLVLANLPASARASINSRINGVQIGAITYSFNTLTNPADIIKAFVTIGLGEMELMSTHCEALAGAPSGRATAAGGRGAQMTPAQQAAQAAAAKSRLDWRRSVTDATFAPVRKQIEAAGITVALLCYNMNTSITDDDIEYAFTMARGLGAKAMSTSTQVSMAKRLAPFAEKHKMMVGFHGHDSVEKPDEVHNEASFKAVMAAGKYLGANLDIGHYTVAKGDPVAFIKQYRDRITNLHLKDKKLDGTNVA